MAQQHGDVPDGYRDAAEEVRAHLVCLRGGAPFLSPSDAVQLVQWFDGGVTVGEILRALERAYVARRRSGSRVPLGLGHAKRHLGRPTVGALAARASGSKPVVQRGAGPLGALVGLVRQRAAGDPEEGALNALAAELERVPAGSPDDLVRAAVAQIRGFRQGLWDRLSPGGRESARQAGRRALGEALDGLDEGDVSAILEEEAREVVWGSYAWLDVATVWDAVEGA